MTGNADASKNLFAGVGFAVRVGQSGNFLFPLPWFQVALRQKSVEMLFGGSQWGRSLAIAGEEIQSFGIIFRNRTVGEGPLPNRLQSAERALQRVLQVIIHWVPGGFEGEFHGFNVLAETQCAYGLKAHAGMVIRDL